MSPRMSGAAHSLGNAVGLASGEGPTHSPRHSGHDAVRRDTYADCLFVLAETAADCVRQVTEQVISLSDFMGDNRYQMRGGVPLTEEEYNSRKTHH